MNRSLTVSLCMIVKNEEQSLPGCFDSVNGLVDEIVVVDTGSSDDTCRVAQSYGAKVHHFPWVDDFSAARNESLRHAGGDWILWLDADERLNPCGMDDCLRSAAADREAGAYIVPIHNLAKDKVSTVHHATRFFRRYPNIAFSGKAHESVERSLSAANAQYRRASFSIDHLGYAVEQLEKEAKLRRNLQLIEKDVQSDPDNAFKLYYLGVTLLELGMQNDGLEVLNKALKAKGLTPNIKAIILNLFAGRHLDRGDYEEAINVARRSLETVPHQNTARTHMGLAYYNRKEYEKALPHLFYAYNYINIAPAERPTEVAQEWSFDPVMILKLVASCLAELSQYAMATSYLHRLSRILPNDHEIHSSLGICYVNCENWEAGRHHLLRALDLGESGERVTVALAFAQYRAGDLKGCAEQIAKWDWAVLEQEQACALLTEFVGLHFKRCRGDEISVLLGQLHDRAPESKVVTRLLALSHVNNRNWPEAIEAFTRLKELSPDDPEISDKLAALHARQAKVHRACSQSV